MTAQATDTLLWRGDRWSIVGAGALFEPETIGVRPVMLHTGAWRGYICGFAITDDRLILDRLEIGLDDASHARALAGEGPRLNGHLPVRLGEGRSWLYDAVQAPVPYTGGVTIGRDFIRELYVHMGFHPAWKYRVVHELTFQDGRLVASEDVSDRLAALRELETKRATAPRRAGVAGLVDRARAAIGGDR